MEAKKIQSKAVGIVRRYKKTVVIVLLLLSLSAISFPLSTNLKNSYENLISIEIRDRHGVPIQKYQNDKNLYATPIDSLPENLEELLIQKEDRFFYYHPGVNPISILRAFTSSVFSGDPGGSSTITQQLVKILLGNEQDRTVSNKIVELIYALSLELHQTKEEILSMYINSVYLGNQAQGFGEASSIYFNKAADELTEQEMVQLLATLSSPSAQNPWRSANDEASDLLASALDVPLHELTSTKDKSHSYQKPSLFEISSLGIDCDRTCNLTIDSELNEQIREILDRNIGNSYDRGVRNGAVVVIKIPENELLSIIGSRDPYEESDGSQINMALQPRPIGSTVKPFIYGKGFEKGLRPYTLVDDREYKYPIATGFPLYPKNFDGQFRGEITLHEALSNSLNVPTVKVLEYVGLDSFYDFLENDLSFIPIQDLHSYQYGIALGGLEMDLLTLSHYFTIFVGGGELKPLQVSYDANATIISPPQSEVVDTAEVLETPYIQLVNKILNDRKTGVNQFGLKSSLNLTQDNYAVKTGTSRDFHDSWVVGYTPDFVAGVWLGNVENTALEQVSGQSGAGAAWQEIMELLFTTNYNKKTPFAFNDIAEYSLNGSIEFGLQGDDIEKLSNSMKGNELILSPHDGDLYEFKQDTNIPLESRVEAEWYVDGVYLGSGANIDYKPPTHGTYEIEARTDEDREIISIEILENTF